MARVCVITAAFEQSVFYKENSLPASCPVGSIDCLGFDSG